MRHLSHRTRPRSSHRHNLHICRKHLLFHRHRRQQQEDDRLVWTHHNLTIHTPVARDTSLLRSGKIQQVRQHILVNLRNLVLPLHKKAGHHCMCKLHNLKEHNRHQTTRLHHHSTSNRPRSLGAQWAHQHILTGTRHFHQDFSHRHRVKVQVRSISHRLNLQRHLHLLQAGNQMELHPDWTIALEFLPMANL